MRKIQFNIFIILLLLAGLLMNGCNDNMPDVMEVDVESIALKEELIGGLVLKTGETADISWKVTVLPENATNRAESYYSSDPEIATVNAKGKISANKEGTCDITIAVGGKSIAFVLQVVDKIIIPATEITLSISTLEMMLGNSYNLIPQIRTLPLDANDGFDFTSSAPGVVTVSEEGLLTAVSSGTADITVASGYDESVKAVVTVTVTTFSGDYPRTGWTMTASHELFKTTADDEKNSLSSALDDDLATNFCLVRPGKKFGNAPSVEVPSGEAIYFTVDMQKSQEVSYFRIRHRNTTQAFVRWYSFDEIAGSNDGVNFEVIATNVVVTDAAIAAQQESPDIAIPKSAYRYLKFYAQSANCFFQSSYTSQGSSVQIQELYLGLNP
jgi:hypothetical protein